MLIKLIFISCAIDNSKRRDVAVMDQSLVFQHTDCDDCMIMRFEGRLAKLMVLAMPQIYHKYVTTDEKGDPILFVQLQNDTNHKLKSALLFYKKLLTNLTTGGFTVNPYDPFMGSKTIEGE